MYHIDIKKFVQVMPFGLIKSAPRNDIYYFVVDKLAINKGIWPNLRVLVPKRLSLQNDHFLITRILITFL